MSQLAMICLALYMLLEAISLLTNVSIKLGDVLKGVLAAATCILLLLSLWK